jgi:CRP-like cAMP-binding protein
MSGWPFEDSPDHNDVGTAVDDLVDVLGSYQHIDDPGHIWFALAVAVSGHAFTGEPLWGMLVGPSSSGKTETARALGLVAGHVDDLTASALMSWTKGKNPRPTGVLYRIGSHGVITIGDFSTVLATSNKGAKDQLFAMLRRAYDGHVTRDLGTASEQLRWHGRLTILACCTPIIDEYTSHADSLGPRWLYYRLAPRSLEGMRAMTEAARIPADEGRARAAQLTERIVTAATERGKAIQLTDATTRIISDLAIVACYGRASVPRSAFGRREITGEATREEPARLYKQLTQLIRALLALGADTNHALELARRCALDSIPQTRRKAMELLVTDLEMTVSEIAREIGCDRKVVRFALEELAAAGVLSWPESYDTEEDATQSQWAPRAWKLDGLAAPLIKRILTGQPWEQNDVIDIEGDRNIRAREANAHVQRTSVPRADQQEQGDFGLENRPAKPDPRRHTL